jgi:large subunit ribosomal protein L29
MAVLNKKDVRKLDTKDRNKKLEEFRLELSKERAKINVGASVSSPGRIREIRKAIARILTIDREKSKTQEVKKPNG